MDDFLICFGRGITNAPSLNQKLTLACDSVHFIHNVISLQINYQIITWNAIMTKKFICYKHNGKNALKTTVTVEVPSLVVTDPHDLVNLHWVLALQWSFSDAFE